MFLFRTLIQTYPLAPCWACRRQCRCPRGPRRPRFPHRHPRPITSPCCFPFALSPRRLPPPTRRPSANCQNSTATFPTYSVGWHLKMLRFSLNSFFKPLKSEFNLFNAGLFNSIDILIFYRNDFFFLCRYIFCIASIDMLSNILPCVSHIIYSSRMYRYLWRFFKSLFLL